jgi:NADPH-ferrihemoprotein reductase
LEEFPTVKIPIDLLFELLPRLQVRYYSISSSSRIFQDSIHITATRLEYINAGGRVVKGVATNWLHHCSMKKLPVQIYVRRSKFKLPKKPNLPVVMVGPGTGFAPFRGFLQDRAWRKEQGMEMDTYEFLIFMLF